MPPSDQSPSPQSKSHSFQAPKGTRDMYPADLLRRRYIEKMWRDTSIRHGFEEIDGPTFEHLDLYTVKSGEGIISELFSFRREGGEKDYALRPEFTPTLARMYAAKAGSLPKPTKWFWQQNCYRAERPQRGRLREFGQWNVDLIGDASIESDVELLGCIVNMLACSGLTPADVQVRLGDRQITTEFLADMGVKASEIDTAFKWLDDMHKLDANAFVAAGAALGVPSEAAQSVYRGMVTAPSESGVRTEYATHKGTRFDDLRRVLEQHGLASWCKFDMSIVRGLAYYTGMVFEVHEAGGKERAIAGGGRYDKLIEMFGGPPTPAVGFGMGDVVLSLVLQDRGLMPEGQALLDKLSEPPASLRPDIFVIANENPDSQAALRPLVAQLRRGGAGQRPTPPGGQTSSESGGIGVPPVRPLPPLHARHTYKATKNIGKILQEASSCHSRFAAIIENGNEATLKNLATGEQQKLLLAEVAARVSAL